MVAVGALTPEEARAAVDGDTIALLLGMMILTAYLTEAAFFRWASWHLLTRVRRPRPSKAPVTGAAIASVIMNSATGKRTTMLATGSAASTSSASAKAA